jgi:riboflavin kinase/FMN adenylyltransferase
VISGKHRGKRLGFPTANILPDKEPIPPDGVYAVYVRIGEAPNDSDLPASPWEGWEERRGDKGQSPFFAGVLNIGCNPTFGGRERSNEVHIFDFQGDIYGKTLEILFLERIREEIRYEREEDLIARIGQDILQARELLGKWGKMGTDP